MDETAVSFIMSYLHNVYSFTWMHFTCKLNLGSHYVFANSILCFKCKLFSTIGIQTSTKYLANYCALSVYQSTENGVDYCNVLRVGQCAPKNGVSYCEVL